MTGNTDSVPLDVAVNGGYSGFPGLDANALGMNSIHNGLPLPMNCLPGEFDFLTQRHQLIGSAEWGYPSEGQTRLCYL